MPRFLPCWVLLVGFFLVVFSPPLAGCELYKCIGSASAAGLVQASWFVPPFNVSVKHEVIGVSQSGTTIMQNSHAYNHYSSVTEGISNASKLR